VQRPEPITGIPFISKENESIEYPCQRWSYFRSTAQFGQRIVDVENQEYLEGRNSVKKENHKDRECRDVRDERELMGGRTTANINVLGNKMSSSQCKKRRDVVAEGVVLRIAVVL
jgi:hypothetical protein